MRFQHEETIAAPPDRVWSLLLDIPRVAQLMPGVENLVREGDNAYSATMKVKLGPISLSLQGKVRLEVQDAEQHHGVMHLEGTDRRVGGSATATIDMKLMSPREGVTQLVMMTEANLMGRLGQFGLPLIKKKVDTMVADFARNLAGAA